MLEALHVLAEALLPLAELAAADVVRAQVAHDAVHDEQLEGLVHHDGAEPVQELCMQRSVCCARKMTLGQTPRASE